MPVSHSKLPLLSVLSNLEGSCSELYRYPIERDIDRSALLDVALDREELLMSDKSIEEIRQALKLRITPSGHWLYRSQKHREVKLKATTTRLSLFGPLNLRSASDENDMTESVESARPIPSVRRVFSASSIPQPMRDATGRLNQANIVDNTTNVWKALRLSTEEKLISPQPLSATHLLVVYATSPSISKMLASNGTGTVRPRRRNGLPTYPEVAELPINDLLFVLNAPNLVTGGYKTGNPVLPRRLHKEMPRVLMHVPHLETFPELVVYLHNKNQAELFRKLIPEWMRDVMHPLPPIPSTKVICDVGEAPLPAPAPASPVLGPRVVRKLLGRFAAGSRSNSSLDSLSTVFSPTSSMKSVKTFSEPDRSLQTIATEIAEVAAELNSEEDTLLHTAKMLDALHDNLCHVGYFSRELWNELDLRRDVLRRAISYQARVEHEPNKE